MGMKDWKAVREALGIKEEQRTVYKVEGRRARLTKDAAIREGLKALAARLDGECECSKGDSVTPDYYCGCHERREQMISRMTPIVKAMPASKPKWDRMIMMYQEAGFLDDSIWEVEPETGGTK
uniref:Uncharacterized protein n=1 Tax=uncultured bacterium A1Q1_fos_25 TaxID=1256569 RepID=L7VWK0_9BACT|nr:hypothetical protein [uncultured bacterium A1Q1_fos_25]